MYGIHINMHGIDSQNPKGMKCALFSIVTVKSICGCCDLENKVKVKSTFTLKVLDMRFKLVQTILVCFFKLTIRAHLKFTLDMNCCDLASGCQGHLRSKVMVEMESLCMVSY